MSSDTPNQPCSSREGTEFIAVDTISANDKPLNDILTCILQHEEAGIPLVVCGLNVDPNWSPLPGSGTLQEHRDGGNHPPAGDSGQQATPPSKDASVWVHQLSLIPKELFPPGPGETPSMTVERWEGLQNDTDNHNGDRPLKQNHCASTFHWLTLDVATEASDVWFILEASHACNVEARLSTESQPIFMTEPEFLSSPFPAFRHVQSAGDLLIIPPRCFAQNLREGSSVSVSWSRMSIHGLSLALHYELPMYRRLCIPEVYNIRKAIYTTMKSHASRINESLSGFSLGSPDSRIDACHSIPRMVNELQKLVRLFDDVLLEEYSNDHDSLFLPDHTGRNPTCNYCGASLFLSYFDCAGVCFDLETDSPRVDMSIRVCGTCYVEGRSCACKNMTPRRLRNFSDTLQERNNAASTLSNYSAFRSVRTYDMGEISGSDFSWPRIAIFQAATELWKLGNTPEIDRRGRTCTPRGGQHSHMMPPNSLINCKKCHAAKCFRHILNGNVHSSEALLANAADSDSTAWHQLHLTARHRDVPSCLTQRRPVDIAEQLRFFALNFSSTSPENDETSVGFYDGHDFQTPARLRSIREEGESGDMSSQILSSAPTKSSRTNSRTNSRASSRSTAVPPPDKETSDHPLATVGRTYPTATEHEETSAYPSRQRSKRPRDPETRDELGPPQKRIRLRRSSTRTLRTASSQSSVASKEAVATAAPRDPPELRQPDGQGTLQSEETRDPTIEPVGQSGTSTPGIFQIPVRRPKTNESFNRPTASTPNIYQATNLRKKPTRTASSSSLSSRPAPATNFGQPSAINYFNPATDLKRDLSTPPPRNVSNPTEQGPTNPIQVTRLLHRSNSLSRRGSFPSLNTFSPLVSSPQFQTHFSTTNMREPSPLARAIGEHSRPAGSSRSLAPEDITRALRERRDSHEDLNAQQVLGSMRGDSLSKENLQGYMELLRESGAFDKQA